jgi:hypothetical protein
MPTQRRALNKEKTAEDRRQEVQRERSVRLKEAKSAHVLRQLEEIGKRLDEETRKAREDFQKNLLDEVVGEVAKKPDPKTGETGSLIDLAPMFLAGPYNLLLFAKTRKGEVVQVRFRQIEQNGVQVFDVYKSGSSTTIYRRPEFPQLITAKDQKEAEEEFARREARQGAKV